MATGTGTLLAACRCIYRILWEVLWFAFTLLKALTLSLAAAWDAFWDTILDAFLQRVPKATAVDIEKLRRAIYANAAQRVQDGQVADFPRSGRGRRFPRSA